MCAKRYTKDDIQRHSAGYYAPYYPAVNVKAHHLPSVYKCAERFHCSEEQAERSLEFAFNAACSQFWEGIQELAGDIFGKGCRVYSAGSSGGWAIVEGLTDIEDWDAVNLAKWRKFERLLKDDVRYLTSEEQMYESIEVNRWAEDGAEEYNFIDDKQGKTHCIVDLKKQDQQSD